MVKSPRAEVLDAAGPGSGYPDNPVLVRVWRGDAIESQHRGAWVLADSEGAVIAGSGEWNRAVFARSSIKSLQALPLLETGAAERFGFSDAEVALALSSHDAEARHTRPIEALLARLGLSVSNLKCGAQPPRDPEARRTLEAASRAPTALYNNCSGKHAGFLALALHLGAPLERYLDPTGPGQDLVREAVISMTGSAPHEVSTAIDGCSAPTFRLPLCGLATAFARISNPARLSSSRREACERMVSAVAAHPELIAGSHLRICTEIARVTKGRIFPKVGGDAVYGIGVCGSDRGLAIKMDDGGNRGLHALILALLRRFRFADEAELSALASWEQRTLRNWSGIEVGRTEVLA